MQKYFVLLRVILSIKHKHQYVTNMICFGLLLVHWRKNEDTNPMWKFFSNQPNMFDAEMGEASFGVMSRVTMKDTMKSNLAHMNRMYRLVRPFVQTNAQMEAWNETERIAAGGNAKDTSRKQVVRDDDETMLATRDWLRTTIHQCSQNQFAPYNGPEAFRSLQASLLHRVSPDDERPVARVLKKGCPLLIDAIERTKRLSVSNWASLEKSGILESWPEFRVDDAEHEIKDRDIDEGMPMMDVDLENEEVDEELDFIPEKHVSSDDDVRDDAAALAPEPIPMDLVAPVVQKKPRKNAKPIERISVNGSRVERVAVENDALVALRQNVHRRNPEVQEEYQRLCDIWLEENNATQLPKSQYYALDDIAQQNVMSRSTSGRRITRTVKPFHQSFNQSSESESADEHDDPPSDENNSRDAI